jgi:hypothetical protein
MPDALFQPAPVEIRGAGVLKAIADFPLRVADLIVAPNAQIVAAGLVVETGIELKGNCSLAASDVITLRERVNLVFDVEEIREAPVLDLGEIGAPYRIVPNRLTVNWREAPTKVSEPQLIVAGRTLGNCEDWKAKLDASLGVGGPLEGLCKNVGVDGAAGRRIRADTGPARMGLFIANRAPPATKKPDNTVVIVVVVVVVVLVIVAIAGVVVIVRRRQAARGSSKSQDSISA